ncbi:MAG: hypothetical protein ACJ75B_16835 [Flavisolibacter sp.]
MEENHSVEHLLIRLGSELSLMEAGELRNHLRDYVNYLLLHDFNKLVQILYRVDVSEIKLKEMLQDHPQTDASDLITDLLIQRQKEKMEMKKSFHPNKDIPEDEKW